MASKSISSSFDDLRRSLPARVMGWKAEPGDRLFDSKTIFDYINGAGEVYRAYNLQLCLSRRYVISNGPVMILDIFDMGSSQDAFGVFTHDREGKPLDIGQGSRYRPGWLSLWKGRFFISVYVESETPDTEKAVIGLGKSVAALIPEKGPRPRILSRLPANGLMENSVRYLHHPIILNYHFYLADENILNIGPDTDAVLATYRKRGQGAWLLLVMYPVDHQGKAALDSFLRYYLPESDHKGMDLLENGKWSAATLTGRLLVIVLDADSRNLAEHLIEEVKDRNGKGP
jgi:hypothetical protein